MAEQRKPLTKVRSVRQLGEWLQFHGISPGENAFFGGVHPVHSSTSLHYKKNGVPQADKQGTDALDVNDRDVGDSWFWKRDKRHGAEKRWKPDSEHEALSLVYHRIHVVARDQDWPLNELFFNGFGFVKELGYSNNHPISGHDTHLHVGFDLSSW